MIQTRAPDPEAPLHAGQVLVYQVPIPEPLRFLEPRETETRRMHALGEYGLMHVKLYEDIARFGHIATAYAYPVKVNARYVMDPSPTPKFDNPKMDNCPALQLFGAGREKRIYAIPPHTKVVSLDFEDHPFSATGSTRPALRRRFLSRRDRHRRQGRRMFVCSDTDYCEAASGRPSRQRALRRTRRARMAEPQNPAGRRAVAGRGSPRQELWPVGRLPRRVLRSTRRGAGDRRRVRLGQVDALQLLSAQLRRAPAACHTGCATACCAISPLGEAERRFLFRTDWGFVHQDPAQGLRMAVSAGANVGERLMAVGWNHYGRIRDTASSWLERVEIDTARIDDAPRTYSAACGSGCRSRAISSPSRGWCSWTSRPAGSTCRCRQRLLDLMRNLVSELDLAAIVVTHDLAVARLLSHRVMVMKGGRVIETGLTDQVLDDPREPYTQLLVSSILPA